MGSACAGFIPRILEGMGMPEKMMNQGRAIYWRLYFSEREEVSVQFF
jgi:hypothetical protein